MRLSNRFPAPGVSPAWIAVCVLGGALAGSSPARADDTRAIASISMTDMRTPEGGKLPRYARGGAASITYLCGCDEVAVGAEVTTMFLGRGETRVVDLGLSFVISYRLKKRRWRKHSEIAVPFLALGLDLAAVGDPRMDEERRRGVTTGIHARAGLHGFLTDQIYWRGQVGFLGAGPGGVTTSLGLGYTFGGK